MDSDAHYSPLTFIREDVGQGWIWGTPREHGAAPHEAVAEENWDSATLDRINALEYNEKRNDLKTIF